MNKKAPGKLGAFLILKCTIKRTVYKIAEKEYNRAKEVNQNGEQESTAGGKRQDNLQTHSERNKANQHQSENDARRDKTVKQQLYAIKDDVTGFNSPIMIMANDEEAKRIFLTEVENPESQLHKWQKDFSLWQIGERDTVDGRLTEQEPRLIIRAEAYIKKAERKANTSESE